MHAIKDRILIVESNPEISEFLAEQALSASNYQVFRVAEASTAISKAKQINPDLIIANLNLPGLSGKDLLVALSSHGIKPPVVMIAKEGQESEIIQAFRLGAADYLTWPVRETEIVLVVERLLDQVHLNREHKFLVNQLTISNQQLQQRVKELTAGFSIGKILTSIHDNKALFEKSLQIAAQICHADLGWFLLRQEEKNRNFMLAAHHNLPDVFSKKINSLWDDGISSLASVSGETLNIAGDPLKRFKVKVFGKSIIIVPVKIQHQTIALLVLMRKENKPFSKSEQRLLESITEFISISTVNARIIKSHETREKSLTNLTDYTQTNEKIILELLNKTENHILEFSKNINKHWNTLKEKIDFNEDEVMQTAAENLEYNLQNTIGLISVLSKDKYLYNTKPSKAFDLITTIHELQENFLPIVEYHNIEMKVETPPSPIRINADQHQIYSVLQGIITNAIQFCDSEGKIRIKILPHAESQVKITISNSGEILEVNNNQPVSEKLLSQKQEKKRFGCIGISFQLIQELLQKNNSKFWIEENPNDGVSFHLLLPTLE
jgi:FixJ family two-component response regulator